MLNRYRFRRPHGWLALILFVLAWGIFFAGKAGVFNEAAQVAQTKQPGLYSVNHFVDGDTIAVNMNGKVEKIRMIGVDTPETHKPNTPVQCYGPAAAAYTKNLVGSQRVRLGSDPLSTDRDRYGRLLRYVYLPDGRLVNELLIQNGYGFYYPYFPFTMSDQFSADQNKAKLENKGLWRNCQPKQTDRGGYVSNPT